MKRTGKFYRKNEAEVMESLGLKPTKNSGSGWIEKEDGQSENVICQLKSTDAQSIKINKKDLDTLQYNASVSHKLPVFAIQFLQSNEVYLVVKPDIIQEIANYLKTGKNESNDLFSDIFDYMDSERLKAIDVLIDEDRKVKSSAEAREQFRSEYSKKFKKEKRSAT